MVAIFLFMFLSLYLAQMGDKTQLLTIFLAAKTKKHFLLFIAIMAAFTISVSLAVLVGAGLSIIIPHQLLHFISGTIFIILGLFLLKDGKAKKEKYKSIRLTHPFFTAIILIFLADFGDKTQIAIALFAADNNPFLVFTAAILALGLDTFLMILLSKILLKKIKQPLIEKIAGLLFIIGGIFLFFQL